MQLLSFFLRSILCDNKWVHVHLDTVLENKIEVEDLQVLEYLCFSINMRKKHSIILCLCLCVCILQTITVTVPAVHGLSRRPDNELVNVFQLH